MAYPALQTAAEVNNADAARILLDLIRIRGETKPWGWMTANRPLLWETPVVVSIRKRNSPDLLSALADRTDGRGELSRGMLRRKTALSRQSVQRTSQEAESASDLD
jgi:hypothetical protein